MKSINTILFLFFGLVLFAQVPAAFTFQGIAMNGDNEVLSDQEISIRVSIVESNPSGVVAYSEVHKIISSSKGHFRLLVGEGEDPSEDFSFIRWEDHRHYIKIEMDVSGGEDYKHISTSELLAVPYAIVAEKSLDGIEGPVGLAGPQGPQGPQGPKGPKGATGPSGQVGPICPPGQPGPPGPPGLIGDPGPAGERGMTGNQGPQGPEGPIGPVGDFGPIGPQGPKGPTGEMGDKGQTGDQGPAGFSGPIGPVGDEGPEGPSMGAAGPEGNPGPPGLPGADSFGAPGLPGNDGFFTLEMTSEIPQNPFVYRIYLDDGTNRIDLKPGLRYFDGTNWIDLY